MFRSTCMFFQIAFEGDFLCLCTVIFCQKVFFELVIRIRTRNSTVPIYKNWHKLSILLQFLNNKSLRQSHEQQLVYLNMSVWFIPLVKIAHCIVQGQLLLALCNLWQLLTHPTHIKKLCSVEKETTFWVGHFATISGHFTLGVFSC